MELSLSTNRVHYQQYFIDCTSSYWKLLEYMALILGRLLKGTQEHNWHRNWIVVFGTALCRGKENSSQALYSAVLYYRLFQRGEKWETNYQPYLVLPTELLHCGISSVHFHSLNISRKFFWYFATFHTVGVVCLQFWCKCIFIHLEMYFMYLYIFIYLYIYYKIYYIVKYIICKV